MTTAYALVPSPGHNYPDHPEEPGRFSRLVGFQDRPYAASLLQLHPPPAMTNEITTVHSRRLVEGLEAVCREAPAIIDYAPTYVSRTSFQDALNAAGATLACTRAVLKGEAQNAFAIVRPPGHHAEPERAMGFCLFNNIALAARLALDEGLQRVMIVDFDVHHGNGTQAAFTTEERLAYFSTHQEYIYPGTGRMDELPHARRRIVNLPLPSRSGDGVFRMIVEEVLSKLMDSFKPEMLFVSAGFDSHWKDPLATLGLSSAGFHALSSYLVKSAAIHSEGRIVFALEGGYNPVSLASGIDACMCALTGCDFMSSDPSPHEEPDVSARLAALCSWHGL